MAGIGRRDYAGGSEPVDAAAHGSAPARQSRRVPGGVGLACGM